MARRPAKSRLAAQDEATRTLAAASSLREAAPRVLALLGTFLEWELGAVWLVDPATDELRCSEIWSTEEIDARAFTRLCRRSRFARGAGIPGRAWAEGEPIWVSDVAAMARSSRVRNTAGIGLHTAFAFPITVGDQTVGAIEFFSTDIRQPDAERLALIASTGGQLGLYIGRARAQTMARRAAAVTRAIMESSPDCIITVDGDRIVTGWNPAAERTFGRTRKAAVGKPLCDVTGLDGESAGALSATRSGGGTVEVDVTLVDVGDRDHPTRAVYARERAAAPEWETALAVHDSALAAAASGIVICDARADDQPIVYVNPAFERITGYARDQALGRNCRFLQVPETDADILAALRGSLEAGRPFSGTVLNARADGARFWSELSITPSHYADGEVTHFVGVITDITAQRKAEERIEHLSHHDPTTGLTNRQMFTEHLELALARAERHGHAVAVLAIDLDGFRLVNDSFGHEAGDELLRQTADRLTRVTRSADVVARHGADEFLVLIGDLEPTRGMGRGPANHADAMQIANAIAGQISIALQAPYTISRTEIFVGATVGIALSPSDAADRDGLLRAAFAAVEAGRQRHSPIEHAPSLSPDETIRRMSLASRLQRAIRRDEFVLHYQPVLDLQAGGVVGVEALVRWDDPERGLVAPGDFIPLAERLGMIQPISNWVISTAFAQASAWHADGVDVEIAVNLPPVLWQTALVQQLSTELETHGLDATKVLIEVTESAAMTDPDRTQRVMAELHDRGLRLAIDDFGTGYSSLSRLKQMPVTTLKIDRSFVSDLPHDGDAASIVRTIIQLAHNLGIDPLAEGIETLAQRRFLVEHDCRLGQGFHFSKAVPAEQIPGLYHRLAARRAA